MRVVVGLSILFLAACAHAEEKGRPLAGPPPFAHDPAPSSYQPLPRTDTLIVGATILDGFGKRLDNSDVLMKDGRIAAVGQGLAPPAGATVIDARGRWVTPGIIDVHTHDGTYALPQSADGGASDVSETSAPNVAETWIEHAVHPVDPAFTRALAAGVTTLQILPGSAPIFGGRSVVVKPIPATTVQAMKFPGAPQFLKMSCGENPKGAFGASPTSRMGEVALMRRAWREARHYAREWDEYLSGEDDDRPHGNAQLGTLAGVLRGDIGVQLHCYRADDIAVMLNLAKEFGFRIDAVHHAAEAYKVAGALRDAGVCAAVWSDWWGWKREAEDGIRENAAFIDAGGGCAIMHSDIPLLGDRLNIEAAKAAAAGRRAGLDIPPERAIRWITSNAARALRLDDRIGSIAVGKNADLVIWSGNPFSIYTKAEQVFIDGAVAFDRRDPARQPVVDFELGRPARRGAGR